MYAARLLRCEGDGNAGVGFGGGVVAVSAYIGVTRGSGVLSSAGDVLEMSVVRGVDGVCDMCLARGGVRCVGGEWVTGLCLGFTNSGGTWGKWDMCLVFWLRWCGGGCCWEGRVGGRLGPGSGRGRWCYVCCESGFSVLMAGPGICIL